MKHTNAKEILIDRAITVLGTVGMDKTTTKAIVAGTGISEVYIYRHFANKEDLLAKAFDVLDEEFVQKAMLHIHIMYAQSVEYQDRCRFFFTAVWEFLLQNQIRFTAFSRYFHSPYFAKYSEDIHKERFLPLLAKFQEAFNDDVDVWELLNHILATMLVFAAKVYDNQFPNDEHTANYVFGVIYQSVAPHFKWAAENNGDNSK